MRAVAFLFALYFAVLGCLSCNDEPVYAAPAGDVTMRAAHDAAEHGGIDWCSPLCQCQCCAGVALPQQQLRVTFREQPARGHANRRYATQPRLAVLTRAPAAPWQPPQGA